MSWQSTHLSQFKNPGRLWAFPVISSSSFSSRSLCLFLGGKTEDQKSYVAHNMSENFWCYSKALIPTPTAVCRQNCQLPTKHVVSGSWQAVHRAVLPLCSLLVFGQRRVDNYPLQGNSLLTAVLRPRDVGDDDSEAQHTLLHGTEFKAASHVHSPISILFIPCVCIKILHRKA